MSTSGPHTHSHRYTCICTYVCTYTWACPHTYKVATKQRRHSLWGENRAHLKWRLCSSHVSLKQVPVTSTSLAQQRSLTRNFISPHLSPMLTSSETGPRASSSWSLFLKLAMVSCNGGQGVHKRWDCVPPSLAWFPQRPCPSLWLGSRYSQQAGKPWRLSRVRDTLERD